MNKYEKAFDVIDIKELVEKAKPKSPLDIKDE